MKRVYSRILLFLICCCIAGFVGKADVIRSLDWQRLAAEKDIPRYEYFSSESLDPAWKNAGVIKLSKNEWLIDFKPEIAGDIKLTFVVACGSEFGPYDIFLNGKKLGAISVDSDQSVTKTIKTFAAGYVSAQSNSLRIAVPAGRVMALSSITWTPAEWSNPPQLKEFYMYNPIPRRCFIAAVKNVTVLKVNGKLVDLKDGFGWIPWRYMNKGFNRVTVDGEPGWSLKFNRVADVKYFKSLPEDSGREKVQTYKLSNTKLKLLFAGENYYCGNRFESPGMLVSAEFDGYECVSSLVIPHNPLNDSSGSGVAEEFFEAVGYVEAKQGEPFIKVGVGLYEKGCNENFSFSYGFYPLKRFGWKLTECKKDRLTWRQELTDMNGWGYIYTKRIVLHKDKPEFHVDHNLKNTGKKRISTSQYSHNIFKLGPGNVAQDYSIKFNFPLSGKHIYGAKALINKYGYGFSRFSGNYYMRISGFKSVQDCRADIFNKAYRIGLEIKGDFVPYRMAFYCDDKSVCPEFFKRIDLAPCKEAQWTRYYRFYKK